MHLLFWVLKCEYDCLQGCYEAIENWLNDNQNLMIGVGAAVLAIEVGDGKKLCV